MSVIEQVFQNYKTEIYDPVSVDQPIDQTLDYARSSPEPSNGEKPVSVENLRQFGDYELLEKIAQGGMGVVFKARQISLNRIVAVKMILSGQFASEEEVQRFYAEAESAAKLDHPNIIPIYEVGKHKDFHFFSMGFVDGESLAEKISERPMDPRETAQKLSAVCQAIEYAHQQGVIHRDLKPANILLDSQGQPRIADFGLAKQLHNDSGLTTTGQILGTPSYMSPEQAEGVPERIGTSSDVYSLGAVLYALLTGRPPFQAATLVATLKQLMEKEPVPLRELDSDIPRDLETIALKCLQKDSLARYDSAQELSAELERFLNGVPILARPISKSERAWRWCRRNPAIAGLAASVVFVLLAGVTFSTWFAIDAHQQALIAQSKADEAQKEKNRADEKAQEARTNETKAKESALQEKLAKQESEASFRQAFDAVNNFFTRVSEDALLNQPGMQSYRKKLLRQALEYYQALLSQRANDPSIREEIAATYFRVGRITLEVDSPEEALRFFKKAFSIQSELIEEDKDERKHQYAIGNTLSFMARVYFKTHDINQAITSYQKVLALRKSLFKLSPENREYGRTLANTYMNLGLIEKYSGQKKNDSSRFSKAKDLMKKAQSLRMQLLDEDMHDQKVLSDFGKGAYNLGNLAVIMGEQSARNELMRAVEKFSLLFKKEPRDLNTAFRLAQAQRLLGDIEGEIKTAYKWYESAWRTYNRLSVGNPDVSSYQEELALVSINLGQLTLDQNQYEESLKLFGQAEAILKKFHDKHPDDVDHRRNLIVLSHKKAVAFRGSNQLQKAKAALQYAKQHLDFLIKENSIQGDVEVLLKNHQRLSKSDRPDI